jgi:hypothetical protein
MLAEIASLSDNDGLASWIHRPMRDKNALTTVDARAIEVPARNYWEPAATE